MNEDSEVKNEDSLGMTDEMCQFVNDLVSKSDVIYEKTESHANCHLLVGDLSCPVRIDDVALLYIGAKLLPNIVNYLVNILPQFVYPYIVAYLQDLSQMRDDPITINELYDFLKSEK